VLVTTGRGALPILQGANMWLNQATPQDRAALIGIILFSPELYSVKPAPGVEARYHSIVSKTSLPVFIYQGQRSPDGGGWNISRSNSPVAAAKSRARCCPTCVVFLRGAGPHG